MSLTPTQKKHLRGLAHNLKPVVYVGNSGCTEAVVEELDQALSFHELIKVRVRTGDRSQRDQTIQSLCEQCSASNVQRIGHVVVLFRPNPKDSKISLPRS